MNRRRKKASSWALHGKRQGPGPGDPRVCNQPAHDLGWKEHRHPDSFQLDAGSAGRPDRPACRQFVRRSKGGRGACGRRQAAGSRSSGLMPACCRKSAAARARRSASSLALPLSSLPSRFSCSRRSAFSRFLQGGGGDRAMVTASWGHDRSGLVACLVPPAAPAHALPAAPWAVRRTGSAKRRAPPPQPASLALRLLLLALLLLKPQPLLLLLLRTGGKHGDRSETWQDSIAPPRKAPDVQQLCAPAPAA